MSRRKLSKYNLPEKTANIRILSGEFLVGKDGQLFTDPADPEAGLKQASAFNKIKHLQKKLLAGKASHSATRYSNRRPQV